jgi:hypothetical protein
MNRGFQLQGYFFSTALHERAGRNFNDDARFTRSPRGGDNSRKAKGRQQADKTIGDEQQAEVRGKYAAGKYFLSHDGCPCCRFPVAGMFHNLSPYLRTVEM